MKRIILLLLVLQATLIFGQEGSISGTVMDGDFEGEPLSFSNVTIKNTEKGTTTDIDGLYEINGLDEGTYTVVFSFIGYETIEKEVAVVSGQASEANVTLMPSSAAIEEVVIKTSSKRESEAALLTEQKKATEIKQSIGAEELSRKGVSDAAGAVAKISGVSKQEGSSNVYVRGLGDRYLNTTMNGLSLPSNDVGKKNIDLNLFGSDIIENVSISKAYATNFYGDFSAGNVNVKSKNYKGKGFFDVSAGTGFNTNAIGKDFKKSEGTGFFGDYARFNHNPFAVSLSHGFDPVEGYTPINTSFGLSGGKSFDFNDDSRLSLFATASFENGYEYRKGDAIDYTLVEKKAFENNAEEYEYSTTITAMATANYRIDDSNKIGFTSLFINNASDEVSYFGIDGKGRNRDAILDTDQGFYQMNVQFDQTQMFVNQLLGNHKSGKFDVDWAFGYNFANSRQPDRKRISLENYQYALDNDPTTNPTFYSNVVFDNQRYFQNIEDEEFNGNLNVSYEVSEATKLNIGYNGRSKTRSFDNIRYGYDILDRSYQVTDVNNFDSFFSLNNLNISPADDGLYELQVINPIPGQSNTNRPGLPENTYKGILDVYAGFANAELKLGEQLLFVPGVRFEHINQSIAYDVINLGSLGEDERGFQENIVLPSLNVKYALKDNQNLRFSISNTISLPEFKEVAPFVYEDVSTRIGGNPDLLDKGYSKIWNLDLKYEWFISRREIFSIGAFAKQINDPVNLVVGADATGTQRYFRTGDKADVYGVELELRKTLLQNEDEDQLLGVGFNATYMHTKQDLFTSIDGTTYDTSFNRSSEELQGASPLILNADISYAPSFGNYQPKANLIFSYFSDRIDALGSGQLGNVVEKGVPTLDFVLKNKLSKNFEINFSAKNILNPTIRYVRETTLGDVNVVSANGKGVSNYKRGANIGLQLKYKF